MWFWGVASTMAREGSMGVICLVFDANDIKKQTLNGANVTAFHEKKFCSWLRFELAQCK
jgi:hypothetical protein